MEKLKVLLFGKKGLLGSEFCKQLSELDNIDFYPLTREDCNVTQFYDVKTTVEEIKPNIIINCTGYTKVDNAEREREVAFTVNSDAVENMARALDLEGGVLIHFSTDYVFDGKKDFYNEDDLTCPLNVYGESKASGESKIRSVGVKHYIVRTSWLFGPTGKNFVDGMIDLASNHSRLQVVNDQEGCPTYTVDLVKSVIDQFVLNSDREYGTYHVTKYGSTSWYDFARAIFRINNTKIQVEPITSEEFNRPAERPKKSILQNNKLIDLRSWEDALKEYLESK